MELFITKKRLIHCLVLILALMSIFRLLRISTLTTTTTFSFPSTLIPLLPSVMLNNNCSRFNSSSSSCKQNSYSTFNFNSSSTRTSPNIPILTHKEYKFLNNLIRKKSPCNLLIFGLGPQYLHLINAAGPGSTTVILEDNLENLRLFKRPTTISSLNHTTTTTTTFIYRVNYELRAKDAFESLQHARKNPSCNSPRLDTLSSKSCKLGLTGLPREVIHGTKWDVIVVDGPSSDGLEAAGRMSSIYTASVLARRSSGGSRSVTNVVVHDVDRTIEKWFAWEFLCDENLVSVKGKLWNFEIRSRGDERLVNSTGFCERK